MLTKTSLTQYNRLCLFGVILVIIHLKDVANKGAVHIEKSVNVSNVLRKSASLTDFGPLEVNLDIVSKDGAAEVTGELAIEAEQPCSRCLSPVRQKLVLPFQETFALGDRSEEDFNLDDDEDDVEYVSSEEFDLLPYLAESVMLALPYVPLCDEACQGLCPVCGENRNETACGCKQDRTDPRLAGLADFFKESRQTK